MKNSPKPVDVYVGSRVRALRMQRGLSQEKLGERLGITFQQIQKYEKGSNRLSASRLVEIARVMTVPPAYFFEGLTEDGAGPTDNARDVTAMMATRTGAELCAMWPGLEAAGRSQVVLDVARVASANQQAA